MIAIPMDELAPTGAAQDPWWPTDGREPKVPAHLRGSSNKEWLQCLMVLY